MDNFTAISKHPVFRKTIKVIVFDAALIDAALKDMETHKEEYKGLKLDNDEASYQRCLEQYREVARDQQAILGPEDDSAVLRAGMELLSNAKTILVFDGLHHPTLRNWYAKTCLGSPDAHPTLSPWATLDLFHPLHRAPWDLRVLQYLLRAISLSKTKLETLVLGAVQDLAAVSLTPSPFTGVGLEHARNAVRSLTRLSVHFQPDDDIVDDYSSQLGSPSSHLEGTKSLVGWLSAAPNLTELTLKFRLPLGWEGTRELLETTLLPHLGAVRLENVRYFEDLIAGFLKRHMLEVADFQRIPTGGDLNVYTGLVAFTKVHLEQVLVKSARNNCWWPSDIKLKFTTRREQRGRIEAMGHVADLSLSQGLLENGVTCTLHGAACVPPKYPNEV